LAGVIVKQTTANGGGIDIAAMLILQLVHATATATIAQALPFLWRHLIQPLGAPKGQRCIAFQHGSICLSN